MSYLSFYDLDHVLQVHPYFHNTCLISESIGIEEKLEWV